MNARQYLKQAYRLNERIKDKEERIADLKEAAISVSAIDYSKDKIQNTTQGDALYVNQIAQIIELEKKLNDDLQKLKRLKVEISQAIDAVDDVNCSLVLSKRYILMKSWEQIAEEMTYSVSQILRIHEKALIIFKVPKNMT